MFSKTTHGYWQSNQEMFARAFACYVKDKLNNNRNDYLCGHAELNYIEDKNDIVKAFPTLEERKEINLVMDDFISELKELNIFHNYEYEKYKIYKNELELEY